MARQAKNLEPAVRITSTCMFCGDMIVLSHPKDQSRICDRCRDALRELILERLEKNANG